MSTEAAVAMEWASDLPSHWNFGKICLVARLESGHTPSRQHPDYWIPSECTIPWFSLSDVWQIRDGTKEFLGETKEKISPRGLANSAARILPAGTVVLSRTASVGFAGIMPKPMATTQDFANWICGPRLLPEFLLYALRAMRDDFRRTTMGSTHQTIYMPDIRRLTVPIPPLSEQGRIVQLLRRRLPAIDSLIAKKERLIELLQEKRQALITQAVTKGPDPTAPMKDSGLPPLGNVPLGWRIVGVKHIATFTTSGSRGWSDYFSDDGAIFLQSGNLDRRLGLDLEHVQRVNPPPGAEGRRTVVKKGDILVCITGALTGNVGVVAEDVGEAYVNQHLALVRIEQRLANPVFVARVLASVVGWRQFAATQYGGIKQGLGLQDIRDAKLALPGRREQDQIVEKIARLVGTEYETTRLMASQVAVLREYRQALITAAVTGQLDVSAEASEAA